VDEGFQFALDDFGAGHSSLITLVAASPHYLKLDRGIVSGVHEDPYKQHLVKAIVSFASSVESKLIAEGIEQIEELETVMRLGVRYAQGFLFARPEENPPALSAEMRMQTIQLMRRFHYPRVSVTAPISAIALRPPTLAPNQKTCDEVDSFFRSTPSVDHIVIVDGENPVGLVPKRHFYTIAGGRFGFPLFQRKPVDKIAKMRPLVIEEDIDITVLGKLAMEREQEDLYDPVVVTDASGRFVGTVTMKRLLSQSIRLELQMATNANPLTGLPGNALIEQWLQEAIDVAKYSIVYADLDRFKEYNDSYGFPQGDAMIKLTAKILSERVGELCADARLGHVGGDDFVIVAKSIIKPDPLQRICDAFDVEKAELFNMQDVRKGSYIAMDRQGNRENVPLVTLSLSALTSDIVGPIPHAGQLGQFAASLKKHVKARNREHGSSGFLFERRRRPGMEGIEAC
jgi:diguanylate cyclase (GGDEF)-like protein